MRIFAAGILVIFLFGLGCSRGGELLKNSESSECCLETPEMIISEFWERARKNDLSGAGELITAAPSKYTQPGLDRKASEKEVERAKIGTTKDPSQAGTGSSDPAFKNEQLAKKLRDFWPSQIFNAKWRLASVESVSIDGDAAKAVIAVTSDGFRVPLKLEVYFKKEKEGWRICSIWT